MEYDVSYITFKILKNFEEERKFSSGKAYLAKLRNSIGRPLSESVEVWPIIFKYIPDEFLNDNYRENYVEKSILITLQLYALHQQGVENGVFFDESNFLNVEYTEKVNNIGNIGSSLRSLRNGDDEVAIDRRFNTMITANDFEEFTYHLRHLIKILKSKSKVTKVNYPRLSQDLYWYLKGYDEDIKLRWSREYYRINFKGEKENE